MADNKEPKLWLTVLKLALGVCTMTSLVWLVLWLADSGYISTPPAPANPTQKAKPVGDWGIVTDSPVFKR